MAHVTHCSVVCTLLLAAAGFACAADPRDQRPYTAGKFQIDLDGTGKGYVKPVEGTSAQPAKQQPASTTALPAATVAAPAAPSIKPGVTGAITPIGGATPQPAPVQQAPTPLAQPRTPQPGEVALAVPDLVIDQVSPAPGGLRPATVVVRNAGGVASAATNLKAACTVLPRTSTNCEAGQVIANLPALAAGAVTTVTVPLTSIAKGGRALEGATVHVCADSDHRVRESNEGNNCRDGRW